MCNSKNQSLSFCRCRSHTSLSLSHLRESLLFQTHMPLLFLIMPSSFPFPSRSPSMRKHRQHTWSLLFPPSARKHPSCHDCSLLELFFFKLLLVYCSRFEFCSLMCFFTCPRSNFYSLICSRLSYSSPLHFPWFPLKLVRKRNNKIYILKKFLRVLLLKFNIYPKDIGRKSIDNFSEERFFNSTIPLKIL